VPGLSVDSRSRKARLPQLGRYLHGAITGRGEIVVPPTEPGDKPIILRPHDRPKKQSTRMLKTECSECGYTIRLTKKWADLGSQPD